MDVEATTAGPLDTGADTIVVGVFDGEQVAHDVPGGALGALLDSGEARTKLGWLALIVFILCFTYQPFADGGL